MDYPANSHVVREPVKPDEPKKITPVVTGEVIRRKPPLGKRFVNLFVSGDGPSVWSYVLLDVLIPAAKDMAADAVSQGIEQMLFGESRSSRRRSSYGGGGSSNYVSYNRYSSSNNATSAMRREDSRTSTRGQKRAPRIDDIVVATRVEADEVRDRMYDYIERYGTVSIADLYELLGVTGAYTDEKWGWANRDEIANMRIEHVRDGYLLHLPRTEPID